MSESQETLKKVAKISKGHRGQFEVVFTGQIWENLRILINNNSMDDTYRIKNENI